MKISNGPHFGDVLIGRIAMASGRSGTMDCQSKTKKSGERPNPGLQATGKQRRLKARSKPNGWADVMKYTVIATAPEFDPIDLSGEYAEGSDLFVRAQVKDRLMFLLSRIEDGDRRFRAIWKVTWSISFSPAQPPAEPDVANR